MNPGPRKSLNEVHTWAGLILGALLFAIFWLGTLSVFDREIDRWMAPMTRLAPPAQPVSIDALRASYDDAVRAGSTFWRLRMPSERQPIAVASYRKGGAIQEQLIDPATGRALPDPETWGGSRFIYPFHYTLNVQFKRIGAWTVGLAAMAMLILCVSGIVTHRKLFADFFTFRPRRNATRGMRDLHNCLGVIGLPFYVAITVSGLAIFFAIFFPQASWGLYRDQQSYIGETFGTFARAKTGQPGSLAPLDEMVSKARASWSGESASYVAVAQPGDAAAVVEVGRASESRVGASLDAIWLDAASGKPLHQRTRSPPVLTAQRFLFGLHVIQFRHWTLRWFYFALGISGCVLIATGLLFWLEARRKRHAVRGLRGVRIVEGLTIGSTTGIIVSTFAFFVVNRVLPLGTTFLGYERAALEAWAFYLVWLLAFGHAWLRRERAWPEQCWIITLFAIAAVLLNWFTTGDHLLRSLAHSHLWSVAGMDLMLLASALVALVAARKLQRLDVRRSRPPVPAELHPAE